MPAKRIMLLDGLSEMQKLDASGGAPVYKYAVERCRVYLGPKKPRVYQVSDRSVTTAIIRTTPQFVAICKLLPDETLPDYLPKVIWSYL